MKILKAGLYPLWALLVITGMLLMNCGDIGPKEEPPVDAPPIEGPPEEEPGVGLPVDMMELLPLKERFSPYFMIGNIATRADVGGGTEINNARLIRHYNILTAENDMKPNSVSGYFGGGYDASTGEITYTWANADNFVNAAVNSGFKVVGHTLLWHSQNAAWMGSMASANAETSLAVMKRFVTDVVTHYKGQIYSWDVLNEAFPDGVSSSADWKTAMRPANPWFASIGSDFVYEGFKAARLADSDAILYYNDYNMDNVDKSTMVRNMVRDVNNLWQSDPDYDNRLLIEGIGMQSHHNTGVSAANVKAALDRFRPLGVKISISELDVLSQTYQQFSPIGGGANKTGQSTVTEQGKTTAANLYGEYFKLFVQNADIIERVTFWGVYDEQSWRSAGLPLLFEGTPISTAKPAYYKILEALK